MPSTHGNKVALTHGGIGQIIGMSRETVTRTLADIRKQRIAVFHASTRLIKMWPPFKSWPHKQRRIVVVSRGTA